MARPRDRFLLAAALLALALWLAVLGPGRGSVSRTSVVAHTLLGVAPSFLAGFGFALWQAFVTRSGAMASVLPAALLVAAVEALQLLLPRWTADVWDVAAGMLGAALAAPLVWWRTHRAGS